MKISVNDKELFSLSDIQKQVLGDYMDCDKVEQDCCRRLEWVLMHLHEQAMKQLRDQWMPKLKGKVDTVPLDDDAFAQLVFSQPDYMDRKARDAASQLG